MSIAARLIALLALIVAMACGGTQAHVPPPPAAPSEPEREVPTAEAPAPSSPPGQAPVPPAEPAPASPEPAKSEDKPTDDDDKPATSGADLTDDESDYSESR